MKKDEIRMELFEMQSDFCKALSDPKRLMIIEELRKGEKSVNEIAAIVGMKQSNTSQHLAVLRKARVISPRREGNMIFYSIANPRVAEACDMVSDFVAEHLKTSKGLARGL